jgi:hypothetical protein
LIVTDTETMERAKTEEQGPPRPDPALKRLEILVGTWRLEGHVTGSDDYNIRGTTSFKWLNDFFLQQDMEMDFAGKTIRAHELIGYNPKTKAFSSYVYSNMAPDPWPYEWDVQGDSWTIGIKHGTIDAAFTGKLSADGKFFTGGWRPRPGADEKINIAYDVKGTRVA